MKIGNGWCGLGVAVGLLVAGCSDRPQEEELLDGPEVDLSSQAKAAAVASGCATDGSAGRELRIYSWDDYVSPDVLAGFEKALGVKVVIDSFESNEEMYEELGKGNRRYDLLIPSSYMVKKLADEGRLEELDHAKLPNVKKNYDPSYACQIIDPSLRYNVPYCVTYTGIAYAQSQMPADAPTDSWSLLDNSDFRGRMMLIDDEREVIGAALMYLGYSINTTDTKELSAAAEQVRKWQRNAEKESADAPTWVALGYSTDVASIVYTGHGKMLRSDIGFSLPKEGFSVAFDEFVVPKDAPHRDLAYAYINYLYDGEVAHENMEYTCGPSPVKPGLAKLNEEYRKVILLDEETMKRGQVLRELPASVQAFYAKTWEKLCDEHCEHCRRCRELRKEQDKKSGK